MMSVQCVGYKLPVLGVNESNLVMAICFEAGEPLTIRQKVIQGFFSLGT